MASKRRRATISVNPAGCLQRCAVPLPLGLLLAQERDEARITTDAIEERIPLEQRITGEAALGGRPEPLDGRVRPVQQCVRQSDVIRGVMEVDVSLPLLDSGLNVLLGAASVARHSKPDDARARQDAAAVRGMRLQVGPAQRERRVTPTQMEK